jgi:hypothetical protein
MGKYDEVIGNLNEVDDDTLNSAHGEARARITELKPKVADRSLTAEELDELVSLRDSFTALDGEAKARTERREAAYAAAQQLVDSVPEDEPEQPGTETPDPQHEQPVEPQPAEPVEEPQQRQPELVAASATPAMGTVTKAAPKAPAGKPAMAITAAADIQGFQAGQNLELGQVGRAMANRLRAVAASGATDGEALGVASITASGIPDDRWLRPEDSIERNTAKIHKVTSHQAITAAGGLCAPLAIDYSYGVLGTQGRPVRDSLPGFRVERGGIQFRKDLAPMVADPTTGPAAATGFWTMANDVAVSDPAVTTPRKAFWVVDCPSTVTAQVEAITFQIEFANITSRFDPETMQANTEAALIWHDRVCENRLLGQLQALSKYITSTQLAALGATRELLVNLDKIQAYYRSVHRLSDNITLRAIMPFWAKHLIRSDIARQMNTDGLSTLNISDEQINGFFATRNIVPVWHLDGSTADQAASGTGNSAIPAVAKQSYAQTPGTAVVPNYPAQVDILLHPEGHFQHLDGGTLDLGIVRDAELVRRNRYRQFSESFEGVAARGVEALRYVASIKPTGGMSGTVAPGDVTA